MFCGSRRNGFDWVFLCLVYRFWEVEGWGAVYTAVVEGVWEETRVVSVEIHHL